MFFYIKNINILMIFYVVLLPIIVDIPSFFSQEEIFSKPNALNNFPIVMVIQFKSLFKAEQDRLFLFQLLKTWHWWRLLHLKTSFCTEKKNIISKVLHSVWILIFSFTILFFFLVFKTSQIFFFSEIFETWRPWKLSHSVCVYVSGKTPGTFIVN